MLSCVIRLCELTKRVVELARGVIRSFKISQHRGRHAVSSAGYPVGCTQPTQNFPLTGKVAVWLDNHTVTYRPMQIR